MGRGLFGFWCVLAAVAAIAFSCEPPVDTPEGKGLNLSWENGTETVAYSTTDASLTVVARRDWTLTVTEGASWLGTPSASSGKGGTTTTIRFSFTENPGETTRTAKIRLEAEGEEDKPYDCVITQTYRGVLAGINKWIYDQMLGWYYWDTAMKNATQPEVEDYNEFLKQLVENAYKKGARDNTENPPTIDGSYIYEDGRYTRQEYAYSYISRTPAGTRAPRGASESTAATFGFAVTPFYLDDSRTQWWLLVRWVRDDSPAAKAGLSRGVWITSIDGRSDYMTYGQMEQCYNKILDTTDGDNLSFHDIENKRYSLNSVEMTASPILIHKTLTTARGTKTAYLLYDQFERGDELTGRKYDFEEELREVFGEFKTEGATELVLDLRYNGGGYVSSCRVLTSLAANVDSRQVFAKMKRNANISQVWDESKYGKIANPEVVMFQNESNSLKLDNVYVLTTNLTASASEMVISSLRGVLGNAAIVQIGERTNGKNVGMDLLETTIGGYDYEMWPITFKVLNAKDYCDYAGGLVPDYRVDEFYDLDNENDSIEELGDKNERLLKAALTLIDGGTVTSDPATRAAVTRADGSSIQQQHLPQDPRRGGAKYIPTQAQTTE